MSVCPPVSVSYTSSLSVCLSTSLSVCLPLFVSVYLSVCLSACLCVCVSVCLCLCLSLCLCFSVCLSVCLCLSLFLSLSLSAVHQLVLSPPPTPRTNEVVHVCSGRKQGPMKLVERLLQVMHSELSNKTRLLQIKRLAPPTLCPHAVSAMDRSTVPR